MSSEHEESGEPLDEGSIKSDAEKSDSPSPKKSHAPGEHAKPRRRGRRGKKRKQRKESGDIQPSGSGVALRSDTSGSADLHEAEASGSRVHSDATASRVYSGLEMSSSRGHLDIEPSFETDSPWNSNEELETTEAETYSGQMIRPHAPHAPKNSTQFIIDDHNECRLYMSFETPNPYLTAADDGGSRIVAEPIGEDAAYIDIDFQYESPQDFDNTAYYDREFELSYKSNRFDELLRLPREELISGLRVLEARLKELSDDLVKENPSPILEKLQSDLLELQEKHCELKEANTKLTALVMQNEKTAEGWTKEERQTSQHTKSEECLKERKADPTVEEQSTHNDSGIEVESKLRGHLRISNAESRLGGVDCDSVTHVQTVSKSDTYLESNGTSSCRADFEAL